MPPPVEIRFGTDGWRGVIARDFTFEAVRRVARAVAATLRGIHPDRQRSLLVIGHDTRFLSRQFAESAAEALAGEAIEVRLTASYLPTPVLAWSIPFLGARAGLMVTASHNPPSYNGIKIRTGDGGPATVALTGQIEAEVRRQGEQGEPSLQGVLSCAGQASAGTIESFDPLPGYRQRLRGLIDMKAIARSRLRVLIDPMYGASQGLLAAILREIGLQAEEIHAEVNPWFGGMQPEPLPESLRELAERITDLNDSRTIGLAFDGDGDRLGAIDEAGSYVTAHQIFALLLRHLVTRRGLSGMVVKTFSSTTMIDRLAARYGLRLTVTPIGFKYIAEVIREQPFLIGGEESGGIGVTGHIPERDGIVSALLLLECLAMEDKPLGALLRELESEVGPHCYRRLDLELALGENGRQLVSRILADPPARIEGWQVREVLNLDGVKLVTNNGAWLLIRPSGTEPVLRLYAEAPTLDQVSRLLEWSKAFVDRASKAR